VAAKYVSTRPIVAEAACKENFQLARKWFKQCWESHDICLQSSIDFMPKRLIEIARDTTLESVGGRWWLRLHHSSKEQIEPYVALSYCWGRDQPFKLTRGTIDSMSNEIMWQDLPQTIKDAILVTQELHIRFLWIDSLCIVQDDAKEISTEIAQMPEIYSSAAVTILASRASNVQEGFLQNRQITKSPDLVFELPYRCLTGELGSVIASIPPKSIELAEPLDDVSSRHQFSPSCIDFKIMLRELSSERGLFKSACCREEFWNIHQFSFGGYVGVQRAQRKISSTAGLQRHQRHTPFTVLRIALWILTA